MLLSAGTFEYVACMPEDLGSGIISCPLEMPRPIKLPESAPVGSRLVGYRPQLKISDAGRPSKPGPRNPDTQRCRISLKASERLNATSSQVSFFLDKGLITALKPGDLLHLVRTGCGRIGISAIRGERMIYAVGAITRVPLGTDFEAQLPFPQIQASRDLFREIDPEFEFADLPIEVRTERKRRVLYTGRTEVGGFALHVLHGRVMGLPGRDECVAVVRKGQCSLVDAISSAFFLDTDHLEVNRWPQADSGSA